MKDKKKIIVPLLLAGVTATGVVANVSVQQQIQVQAETNAESEITKVEGAVLNVGPFRKLEKATETESAKLTNAYTFSIGDKVYMPKVSGYSAEETIKYTIKKGNKTFEPKSDGNGYYFEASYPGYYDITISATGNNQVTTTLENLSIFVESEEATIVLPKNSEEVIPAKMPKGQKNFVIPTPSVILEDEEDALTETELAEYGKTLSVRLLDPAFKEVELEKVDNGYKVKSTNGLNEVGTYTIVYECKSGNSLVSRLESSFNVVHNYDTSKIKLKMKLDGEVPSTGNVNTDIAVPKVTVSDSSVSKDEINAYVKVVVKNVKTGNTVDVNYDNNGKCTFCPKEEGLYSVSYTASIKLFGITTETYTPGQIIDVTDKAKPDIYPTLPYKIENGVITEVNGVPVTGATDEEKRANAEELLTNRRVDIPAIAVMKTHTDANGKKEIYAEVKIPAAYATDNFYTFKGGDTEDIVISRTYRNDGAVTEVSEPANEIGICKFKSAGNQEIRYRATDKAGNYYGDIIYNIVVYDENADLSEGETIINLNVGTSTITDKEKTLTFAKPKAIDTYDDSIEVKTFYKIEGQEEKPLETNNDGNYVINIADLIKELDDSTNKNSFEIYSRAYVDEILVNTRGDRQLKDKNYVESNIVTVQVLRTQNDAEAPEFQVVGGTFNNQLYAKNTNSIADETGKKIGDDGYLLTEDNQHIAFGSSDDKLSPFDQNNGGKSYSIELPEVTFTDSYDENLNVSLIVKNREGTEVTVNGTKVKKEKVGDKYVYTISGAKVDLGFYGMYTVTYVSKDFAGNITVKTFAFRANDKTAPTIIGVEPSQFSKTVEVGTEFEVPTPNLQKDGKTLTGGTTIWWEVVSADCKYEKSGNKIKPLTQGEIQIQFYGIDEHGNKTEDKTIYTISAKDTIKPTLKLTSEIFSEIIFPSVVEWPEDEDTKSVIVKVPTAIATDKYRGQLDVKYTITGPSNTTPTLEDYKNEEYDALTDIEKDNVKYFEAKAQGVYTITYYAIDDANNEVNRIETIKVGDCTAPELTWENRDKDFKSEAKLNETYKLDLNNLIEENKLTLSDNKTSQEDLISNLTISVIGPDGTTVKNLASAGNGYEWKFTKSGEYTLTFEVKDNVGTKSTYSYTINVPNEETESKKVSPVLGTVLVVLSVVVLAGVVVYFVASSKKKSTKKSSNKKN